MSDSPAIDGFYAYQGVLAARTVPYFHTNVEFAMVLSGLEISVIGGRSYALRSQHVDLFWGAMPHLPMRIVRPGRFTMLHIPLPWFMHCDLPPWFVTELLEGRVFQEKSPKPRMDSDQFERWSADLKSDDPERRAIVRGEVAMRLRRMALNRRSAATPEKREPIDRDVTLDMARYVAENYQHPLTLADIADAANVSPRWGAKLFRRAWHMSPTAYVTRHRLAEAQRLLATTPLKIVDIALQSGFGSVSQFYAEFEKAFGYSPRQCRLQLTGAAPNRPRREHH